MSAELLQTLPC